MRQQKGKGRLCGAQITSSREVRHQSRLEVSRRILDKEPVGLADRVVRSRWEKEREAGVVHQRGNTKEEEKLGGTIFVS